MTKTNQPVIIGFDILPKSSPSARRSPRYALATINEEGQLVVNSPITRTEMLKQIRRTKPEILATDNLFELASTEKEVIDFLSKIPSKTRIMQVTGSPIHGLTSLTKLAKRQGLKVHSHPEPVESAKLIVQLAALGIGTEVSVLARETRVIVSRARNIGPGGFSQARFQRRMHGAIQQVSRSIIEKIGKAQIDYDQFETRTTHGLSRCLIHVYESYDNVSKIIQSEINRIAGVAVRISPVKHRTILYQQKKDINGHYDARRLLVIGVDAGTTVGIAIADINGRLLALNSGRGLSRGDVIRYLVEYGKPVLIAADVSPAPSFVEKLTTTLQTHLFVPERLLSVAEKRKLAKSFGKDSDIQPRNAHQRDALAAIASAFQVYGQRIDLLKARIASLEQKHDLTEAVKIVIQNGSIQEALEKSVISEKETVTEKATIPPPSDRITEPTLERLQTTISQLRRQIESLQRQLGFEKSKFLQSQEALEELKKEYQQAKRQLNRILTVERREQRRDELIQRRNAEITRLQTSMQKTNARLQVAEQIISNLKLMRQLENRGEVQPLLVLQHFSQVEIRQLKTRYTRKRRKLVLIHDPSGGGSSTADQLIQFGVQVIISKGIMSHLALEKFTSAQIPVLDASKLRITMVDEFAVVNIEELEKEISRWQKLHKISEHEEAADSLERLIDEYREERRNQESKRK
ncbi:MAG: DUF460 domain-containing protein [Promethearchaeota archaeon]